MLTEMDDTWQQQVKGGRKREKGRHTLKRKVSGNTLGTLGTDVGTKHFKAQITVVMH